MFVLCTMFVHYVVGFCGHADKNNIYTVLNSNS